MTLANVAKQIAADPEAQYQALQRSLRRRKGFGLLFVQASPAKASELLQRLHKDLPQKNIGSLVLDQPITNLYNLVAQRPDLADLHILFIQGIEKSLEADIKPGYGGEGDYYNLNTVPSLLNHLNQQRDNFRDHFGHLCFVFVVPPFALKYLIRRAADFLDWRSAIFTFADVHTEDRQIQTPIAQGEAIEDSTFQALINLFAGNAKYEAGDYEAAIAAYDAALALKPDKHEALYNKGHVLVNLGQKLRKEGFEEAALAKLSEGIAAYDAALALKPDYHEALFNKGVALDDLGQYEAAIACYDAALALKPDCHEAFTNRGGAYLMLGYREQAKADFNRATEIDSRNPMVAALSSIADLVVNQNQGSADSRLADLMQVISSPELLQQIQQQLAQTRSVPSKAQQIKQAQVLAQALGLNPDEIQAQVAKYFDDPESQLQDLQTAPLLFQANLAFQQGNYEAAIAAYNAALALKPDDPNPMYNKACCYGLQGDADNAFQALQAAIDLDPNEIPRHS